VQGLVTDPAHDEVVPLKGIRRAIATNVMQSLRTTAQVTSFYEIDAEPLVRLRDEFRARKSGAPVGYDALLVFAVAMVLPAHPLLQARVTDAGITLSRTPNIGIAVALDESFGIGGGLIVPVIRNAGKKTVDEIATELADKVARARSKTLEPGDVQGGTFTISNLGGLPGADHWRGATPIINGEQSAILAVGRIRDAVVVGPDRTPVVRPTLALSLTHDHRLVDGAPAGAFVDDLVDALADPGRFTSTATPTR
jgi:pyruvate/2-oxoglutarate dehydrogenase complex dihydrolipoamide acyltransferase (E2) component